jgi:hypothetical protein
MSVKVKLRSAQTGTPFTKGALYVTCTDVNAAACILQRIICFPPPVTVFTVKA